MGAKARGAIIDALVETLPPTLYAALERRDTCVLSSNIGRAVLRSYGIDARPLAVRALVCNRVAWEATEGDLTRLWEMTLEDAPEEFWTVGLGFGEREPGRFPGHLILSTRNPDRIIDLTLDQASRPDKGIRLEPFSDDVDREALRKFERGEGVLRTDDAEDGSVVAYGRVPDLDYRRGTDWRGITAAEVDFDLDNWREEVVGALREKIADRLR